MQFQDMRIFPTRYGTSFLISGDVFDSVGGDALIDKISDLYLLQTEAAKRTLDFQVAGTKNGAIAVVQSATTGANGTVTCSTTVANGGTFGSFKIKDGARLQFISGSTNIARGSPTTGVVADPGGNNRSTSVVTFDTVPAGTTTGDYLTYENSALKAPHGLADLVNNDTQSRVRSSVTMVRKPSLIDLEAATPTRRKGASSGRTQRERLTEKASFNQDGVIVCSYGNPNRKRLVEIPNPASKMRVTIQGEIQGQLRSNRPYLKSIVLNATTQRLQVALLVEVHFSLRYRTDNPGNTLILSSPTQKAAYMSPIWDHYVAIHDCKSPLIDSEAETLTRRKDSSGGIMQRERTSEAAPISGGTMFWSYGKKNHKRLAETANPGNGRVTTTNGYNLQRFDGGGGTLRMDFTDVKFGEGITWETHVAIDPDRCYGVNPAEINIYELMKFGAYAKGDATQIKQYSSGGTYYDQWIGFLGCENSQLSRVTVIEKTG